MTSVEERRSRRLVRRAMRSRDINVLHFLINGGADVNKPLSDVSGETPLTFAIKHGYLEIVELLLAIDCRKNAANAHLRYKSKHSNNSPLDVAVKSWLDCFAAAPDENASLSRHYRILRLVLEKTDLTISQDMLTCLVDRAVTLENAERLRRLVTVVCHHGQVAVRSQLLVALAPFHGSSTDLGSLLISGADVTAFNRATMSSPCIPLENAVMLVRACNDSKLLDRVEVLTSHYAKCTDETTVRLYQLLLRLLVVCGHRLHLSLLHQLYISQVRMYKWIHIYTSSPPSLGNLSRITLRKLLRPNVLHACANWTSLPEAIRDSITFKCWLHSTPK